MQGGRFWILAGLVFVALIAAGFGARAWMQHASGPAGGGLAPSMAQTRSAEFSRDPALRSLRGGTLENAGPMELVATDTGGSSTFRQRARGVVRVDLKFRSATDASAFVDDTCTGAIISTRHVLTARHCLINAVNAPERLVAARIVLDYATADGEGVSFLPLSVSSDDLLTGADDAPEQDFAVLTLAAEAAGKVDDRVLKLAAGRAAPDRTLFILHHPLGHPLHLSQTKCFARAVSDTGVVSHACATLAGSSGAPVFDAETGEVVAIHSSSQGTEEQMAISLDRLRPALALIPEFAAGAVPDDVARDDSGAPVWETLDDSATETEVPADAAPNTSMESYVLDAVAMLAAEKKGLGYGLSDYFSEDLDYGPDKIRGKNSPSTMCVAAVTEVMIRAVDAWAKANESEVAFEALPGPVISRKSVRGLWPWMFQWDIERKIPAYDRNFATGARDAFVLFGIGRSVKFEEAEPGDFIYFNRTNGGGHAAIFLGYLKRDYQLTDVYDADVVGFKYFSSQQSGTPGFDYRAGYFTGYCPAAHAPDLRKDCSILRRDDPKFLSMARLLAPSAWQTGDTSLHVDALLNGKTLEEIEATRFSRTRSLSMSTLRRSLELDAAYDAETLTQGPAVAFTGETLEEETAPVTP